MKTEKNKTEPCEINKTEHLNRQHQRVWIIMEDSVKEPVLVLRSALASFPCESRMNRSNAAVLNLAEVKRDHP